jgi:hypothetical protein
MNFSKSDLFWFGKAEDETSLYTKLLALEKDNFLLFIWAFRFIIEDIKMLNENTSGRDYKRDYVVGN